MVLESGFRIQIEICQKIKSDLPKEVLKKTVKNFLKSANTPIETPKKYESTSFIGDQVLKDHVEFFDLIPSSSKRPVKFQDVEDSNISFYITKLNEDGYQTDEIYMADGEEGVQASRELMLPSRELNGIWENLIYDEGIKEKLLRYVNMAMLFSDKGVDPNLISWNRVVLLHGPPGTGKTSLCRALAQKLSIQLSDRFTYGYLVEINSHSLFSKWFSESGKLVQRMFEHVHELVEDPNAFVCLLIDEIESLAAARKSSGNEPSDAIRVVNAVLTQIDAIKQFRNVLILTTSNITGTVDLAFVDRADIKQYIGPPSSDACYAMLRGSVQELKDKQVINCKETILPFDFMKSCENNTTNVKILSQPKPINGHINEIDHPLRNGNKEAIEEDHGSSINFSKKLYEEAQRCQGLSGRTLRKLPFLTMTEFNPGQVSGHEFLMALSKCITSIKNDLSYIENN